MIFQICRLHSIVKRNLGAHFVSTQQSGNSPGDDSKRIGDNSAKTTDCGTMRASWKLLCETYGERFLANQKDSFLRDILRSGKSLSAVIGGG